MRVRLILSMMLLCVLHTAFGEKCGLARDTDLDGSYTSSTSTDQCSGVSAHPSLVSNYRLSQTSSGQRKLIHLVEVCRVSVHSRSPRLVKEVALDLFRVATTEQGIKSRVVGQKNAAACLSYADPVAAMELLSKVDFQRPRWGEWLYEDPRYNAAETIFVNFAKLRPLDISTIGTKARYLGQTGQYPYFGIAKVIQHLPHSLRKEANALLNDALAYYSNEKGFYNRDEEFLRLLQSLNDSLVDKELVNQALASFVRRLKNDPIHLPGDYYSEVQIDSNGKTFSFTDRNQAFLFQAFPAIRRFDPASAAQLAGQDARFEQATDEMTYIPGGFVQGNLTSEQITRQHLEWLQASLVDRIQQIEECSGCNQQVASHLIQRLTELNSQTEFSAAIPDVVRSKAPRGEQTRAAQ